MRDHRDRVKVIVDLQRTPTSYLYAFLIADPTVTPSIFASELVYILHLLSPSKTFILLATKSLTCDATKSLFPCEERHKSKDGAV